MTPITHLLGIFLMVIAHTAYGQLPPATQPKPYNKNEPFRMISSSEILPTIDSLHVLIVNFKGEQDGSNLDSTLVNNPQIIEVQLVQPSQSDIQAVSDLHMPYLTHFFVLDYMSDSLRIPEFPGIQHLTIHSAELRRLSTQNAGLSALGILDIRAPELVDWKADSLFPSLTLINLEARKLGYFPIRRMPQIREFLFACAFRELPENLCQYERLIFISFRNFGPVPVHNCLRKKIHGAVSSNLTVYGDDGHISLEILSEDRKK